MNVGVVGAFPDPDLTFFWVDIFNNEIEEPHDNVAISSYLAI